MGKLIIVDDESLNKIIETQNLILNLLSLNNERINQSNKDLADLMTVKEASNYLHVSEVFLRKKLENRELPKYTIGKKVVIKKEDLNNLIKES